ncbi:MAG: hypothetical protein AB1598_12040 [Thermodesulfobacteriota bacterium]
MTNRITKLITSNQYHLWTDALHARALARQSDNEWDRGAYVRWAVNTAWTVFEVVCEDVTGASGLGNRFKDNLNEALADGGYPVIKWGEGIWQRVANLYEERKRYTHRGITDADLFPELSVAENAISVIRKAIINIHNHVSKEPPDWAYDDADYGLIESGAKLFSPSIHLTHMNAKEFPHEDSIRIVIVSQGKETETDVFPPGASYQARIEELIKGSNVPMTAIKVYQGDTLIEEYDVRIRGS